MADTITCPQCRRQYRATPQLTGKKVKCKCGALISVPESAAPSENVKEWNPFDDLPTPEAQSASSPPSDTAWASKPLELLRRGWRPYKFPQSNVAVLLPRAFVARHDEEGTLVASSKAKILEITATLHANDASQEQPADVLEFVADMARNKNLKATDTGTYRYFFDPGDLPAKASGPRFWVVGIPGALVVISIECIGLEPATLLLKEVRDAIPFLIGEIV